MLLGIYFYTQNYVLSLIFLGIYALTIAIELKLRKTYDRTKENVYLNLFNIISLYGLLFLQDYYDSKILIFVTMIYALFISLYDFKKY